MSARLISAPVATRWPARLVPWLFVGLSAIPVLAGAVRLRDLAVGAAVTAENARFFAAPVPVVLHIVTATVFTLTGAFQLPAASRRRNPRRHRRVGMVVVAAGVVAALTGLWMAHFYPWPPGDGAGLYVLRLVFGVAMLAFLVLGVLSVRRRAFARHGTWMARAYAIGLGAGTQALLHLPFLALGQRPGEGLHTVLMGAGWVVNLAVVELVRRPRPGVPSKSHRRRPAAELA